MTTVDRIFALQAETGKTSKTIETDTGISNGSFSKWKGGSYAPSADAILKLAKYFGVSTDYLFCLSDVREIQTVEKSLSEQEQLLIDAFRSADTEGQFNIIYVCMDEKKKASGRKDQVG